ncbi:glycosyltransferase [Candidatus Pelagibacter sp. HIMB1746]|uniref:glycosyltransferase n=1 Tax=Candidatus Pelagibacter sp. HIMB1746 TaxID=3413370 RepID=UPI003F83D870
MQTNKITFVIVTFHSENIVFDCLDLLPRDSKKIIIENSNNSELKALLEKKYSNLKCYLMDENLGYGKANNIGINYSQTDFVFILNPDVRFRSSDLNEFLRIVSGENFVIAAPIENEELKTLSNQNKFEEVDYVKGFAMLLNKKYLNGQYFDENIFLYLEEIDLCKRVRDKNGRILKVNIPSIHMGAFSHGDRNNFEMEKSRNWHWMWSKFYYQKKHYGYLAGIVSTFPNFLSSFIKYIFFSFILNMKKKNIYKMRFLGLLNSYLLKKSYHRPNLK